MIRPLINSGTVMNVTMGSSLIELISNVIDAKMLLITVEHVKKTLNTNSDVSPVNSDSYLMSLLVTLLRFQTARQSLLSLMSFVMNAIGLSVEVLMEDNAYLANLLILVVLHVLLINMEFHLYV